jgi:hypothetical protein
MRRGAETKNPGARRTTKTRKRKRKRYNLQGSVKNKRLPNGVSVHRVFEMFF